MKTSQKDSQNFASFLSNKHYYVFFAVCSSNDSIVCICSRVAHSAMADGDDLRLIDRDCNGTMQRQRHT